MGSGLREGGLWIEKGRKWDSEELMQSFDGHIHYFIYMYL